jgi:hypothetical protein
MITESTRQKQTLDTAPPGDSFRHTFPQNHQISENPTPQNYIILRNCIQESWRTHDEIAKNQNDGLFAIGF